ATASLVLAELRFLRQEHLALVFLLRVLVFLLRRALGCRLGLGHGSFLRRGLLGRRCLRRRLPLLGALVARLVELGRVFVHLLPRRRVGRVGDCSRRLFDLWLDHRLLTPFGGNALLVRARLLDRLGWRLLTRAARTASLPLALADRKSTRLNSSHVAISYAVFCLKKKKNISNTP